MSWISYAEKEHSSFEKGLDNQKAAERDCIKILLPNKILISFLRLQTNHSQLCSDSFLCRFRANLKMPQEDWLWGTQFGSCTACWSWRCFMSVSSALWLPECRTTIWLDSGKCTEGTEGCTEPAGSPPNAAPCVPEKHFLFKSVSKSHCGRESLSEHTHQRRFIKINGL